MYCQHFGFHKSPFKITPDPELFFPGGNRGAVLDALIYAISRGEGIVKVVGEVGSGKTMLCRMLAREIPANCEMIYLANPNLGPDEILPAIAYELKLALPPGATKPMVMHALHDYLLAKHADNRRVVMFVEEAQGMPLATLEELRLLSNLETAQDKLLQIVLFGQPELDTKLAQHEIRQLNERITYRFKLAPFVAGEIRDYLNARLQASGYRGPELFTRRAIRVLTRSSQGLLRRINVLADKALLAAYSSGAPRVLPRHVTLAAQDSEFALETRTPAGWWRLAWLTGLLLAAGAGWHYAAQRPAPVALAMIEANTPRPTVASAHAPARAPVSNMRYTDLTALALTLATFDNPLAPGDQAADSSHLQNAFNHLARLADMPGEVLLFGVD